MEKEPLAKLYFRQTIAQMAVRILEDDPDDPRQPEALAHYRAQLAQIDAMIEEREAAGETLPEPSEQEEGEPEGVVVKLKPGYLFSKGDRQ